MPLRRTDRCKVDRLPRRRAYACALTLLILGAATIVFAIESLQVEIERIDGAGWSAEGVVIEVGLPQKRVSSQVTIARFTLDAGAQAFRNVRITCADLELSAVRIGCPNASLALTAPAVGPQQMRGAMAYDRRNGAIDADFRGTRVAGGAVRVRAALREGGWRSTVDVERLDIEAALKLANQLKLPLPEVSATGRLSGRIEASGTTTLSSANIAASIAELTANNASGTLASDKLSMELRATLSRASDGWQYDAEVASRSGQAYAEPVFLDLGVHPLQLQSQGTIAAGRQIVAQSFSIEHTEVLQATGSARIDLANTQPLRDLHVSVQSLQFPGAYASYLQPFLIDTDFKSLKTSGRLEGVVHIVEGQPKRMALLLSNLDVDDGTRTFVMHGLSGQVSWRDGEDEDEDAVLRAGAERSSLRWQGGSLLNLAFGRSVLHFTTIGRNFRLIEPASVPLLDGAVDFESLRIRNIGLPTVAFMVDANVRPISVAEVCRAFDWPEFGGSIGGAISKLRLRDGVLTLGTTLQASVFDGQVAIRDLRLEDALGKWPRFYSSIQLENLDLELVTRAFSFGRITGRLSGAIDGLQLFNWQAIAFDARLYTPPNDRSRHRISQRAVENIGSIGGGGAGITQALSSGFLRFFEEFRYDRLGLSCRLENEVCHMNGVEPAPNGGYYLVKGSGLPRIDVIGNSRRVDWPRLVQQLIAVTESEGPVVE